MDFSFNTFLSDVSSNPILCITVLLTLGVIFVNGWTDAPNAIATCITTRCMRVRSAILMSAVFNFLGVLIMTHINSSVASTISNMVDFGGDTYSALIALCAALFSIVIYSVAASCFGIPTSESHSLIAGLTGAALAIQNGAEGINMEEWSKVLYGLVLSLVLGFVIGWVICRLVTLICGSMERRKINRFFGGAQIFGAAVDNTVAAGVPPSQPVKMLGQTPLVMRLLGRNTVTGKAAAQGGGHDGEAPPLPGIRVRTHLTAPPSGPSAPPPRRRFTTPALGWAGTATKDHS